MCGKDGENDYFYQRTGRVRAGRCSRYGIDVSDAGEKVTAVRFLVIFNSAC